ncbi:MAG: alpha/beta hydrolase [Clostridia bacterium]
MHGWGCDGNIFTNFAKQLISHANKHLVQNLKCLLVDFPPFGKSEQPKSTWSLQTYVNLIKRLLLNLNIKSADFVCHSFGGRVAICLASENTKIVNKLVLCASAGIKPKHMLLNKIKIAKYKFLKKYCPQKCKKMGSTDWKNLSPIMKHTFSNIIGEHLENYAKKISNSTLLIWGNLDTDTPPFMAKKLLKLIKNSGIVWLNGGHFTIFENFYITCAVLKKFLL